jgi:hypothetical protein
MKATLKAAFAPILVAFAAFCALTPSSASAQSGGAPSQTAPQTTTQTTAQMGAPAASGRGDIFTVVAIPVDVTAASAPAAQAQGFAAAAQIGFQRVSQRLTLPSDRQRIALPQPDPNTLQNLAVSTDVVSERRSSTHYVAQLSVHFNPELVRTVLHQAGFANLTEQRAAPVLLAPQGGSGLAPETLAAWRQAWSDGGFANELTPLAIAPANATGSDWASIYPFAQALAANSAVQAILNVQANTASATVRSLNAQGAREYGTASVQIASNDPAALRAALNALALQVNNAVQDDWKAHQGVASTAQQPVQSSRISASALYANEHEWEEIKGALQGAASTLISQIRIEAVAREGALVSFSYIGDRSQLAAELNRRGVALSDSPQGPVLRVAPAH